jgi:hypothetical protein
MMDGKHMFRISTWLKWPALLISAAACATSAAHGQSSQGLASHSTPTQDVATHFSSSLTSIPKGDLPVRGAIYVPAYSSVFLSSGKARVGFSVTLSVHNVSKDRPLVLTKIAYFDTSGALVQDFLPSPVALKPFATVQVSIPVTDVRGGAGANFIVEWAAEAPLAEPVVEALMLGTVGNASYSFISPGRAIVRAPPN